MTKPTATSDCGKVVDPGKVVVVTVRGVTRLVEQGRAWCARRQGHSGACDPTGLADVAG